MDMNERSRIWFFTIGKDKFKKENSEAMVNWFKKFCKKTGSFGVMQVEQGKSRGNSGLPGAMPEHEGVHLHAMISFKSQRTRGGVCKAVKAWAKKNFWLVKPENTEGTIKYCSKEDTRIRETIWVNKELQPMPNGVKRGHTEMVDKIFAGGGPVETGAGALKAPPAAAKMKRVHLNLKNLPIEFSGETGRTIAEVRSNNIGVIFLSNTSDTATECTFNLVLLGRTRFIG